MDLSNTPSDPTELALWVARQISNFHDDHLGRIGSDSHLSHPSTLYSRRPDGKEDPLLAAERERVREENRERKKRWRESNVERSMFIHSGFFCYFRV